MCYSVLNVVLLWSLTGVHKELCWKYSLHFLPLYLPVQLEANQDQHEPKILCFILIPGFIDVMKTESNSVTSRNNEACNYRQISCCVLVDWAVLGLLKDVTVSCSCTLGRRRRPSGWRQRLSCKSSWLETTQMLLNEFHWGKRKLLGFVTDVCHLMQKHHK